MPVDPNIPGSLNPGQALAERFATLERKVRLLEQPGPYPIVDSLPPAGLEGRLLILRSDRHLYSDTGTGWHDHG